MLTKLLTVAGLICAVAVAQVSSIDSLAPSSAPVGSAATALTVTGKNIAAGSVVSWTTPDGRKVTISPSLVQAAQVAATIPAALLSTSGTANVAVVDGAGVLSNQLPFRITQKAFISLSAVSLPGGAVGASYSGTLAAKNGTGPYTWTVTGGSLPTGLSLDAASGNISGIPAAPGTFFFGVQAADSTTGNGTGTFQIAIAPQALRITNAPALPTGIAGLPFPGQVLGSTGGIGPYTYSVTSGTLPAGLRLSGGVISGTPTASGVFSFVVTSKDSATPAVSVTLSVQVTIRVAGPAALVVGSSSVVFSGTAGGAASQAPVSIPVSSSDGSSSLNYQVAVSPAVSWLSVLPDSKTPGTIDLTLTGQANLLSASATAYQTTINVTCVAPSVCAGSSQTITVSLTVTDAPAQLSVTTQVLAFTGSSGSSQTAVRTLNLQNAGGGSLVVNSITAADSWITVGPLPAPLSGGASAGVAITADSSKLSDGFYTSSLSIVTSAGRASVPVTISVATGSALTLAPAGTQIPLPAGGRPGNVSGTFRVGSTGVSPVNFSVALLPGANWLTLGTASGTTSPASPGTVSFAINPVAAALLPQQSYYGTIRVTAPGAVNSPQDFQVVLDVRDPLVPASVSIEPGGVVLTSAAGKTVTLYTTSATPLSFSAGGRGVSVSPASGTVVAGQPATTVVSAVNPGAGGASGTAAYAFSNGQEFTVPVSIGNFSGSSVGSSGLRAVPSAGACSPTKMLPVQTGLPGNFSSPTSWPTPLSVIVIDDCGAAVATAQVVATFSNGDAPMVLSLVDSSNGVYSGTWIPRHTAQLVSITGKTSAPNFATVSSVISGQVTPGIAPTLNEHSVLQIFNPVIGGALAPGNIVQMYGTGLAAQPAFPLGVPLPVSLAGTSVFIGGIAVPLFYAGPNQINAQVPYELAPGRQYQVIVSANGALTAPETIQVNTVAPGVLGYLSGALIAQHASDSSLVTEASPAKPGEYVTFYLAGMGTPDVPVATGAAAPGLSAGDTLARPQVVPTLTVNGKPISIYFAGLSPGFAGLYQVSFQIPADATDGELSVVITQGPTLSNSLVLPISH